MLGIENTLHLSNLSGGDLQKQQSSLKPTNPATKRCSTKVCQPTLHEI
jgi:hypothetical protein